MSIRTVVTAGFGNGSFNGSIADVVTRGYIDQAAISSALSGTVLGGLTELQVRTGGETVIIDLVNDTWLAAGPAFNAQRQNIIDGLSAALSPAGGWNLQVRDLLSVSTVVRTSDTRVTITLAASPGYDVTINETVTQTVPASALVTSTGPVVAAPSFSITADPPIIVTDKMGDPGQVRRKKHPAWREMEERLKREYEVELNRLKGDTPDAPEAPAPIEVDQSQDYLQQLFLQHDQIKSDINVIRARIESLQSAESSGKVVMLEQQPAADDALSNAQLYLELMKKRQAKLDSWIAVLNAVVLFYFY